MFGLFFSILNWFRNAAVSKDGNVTKQVMLAIWKLFGLKKEYNQFDSMIFCHYVKSITQWICLLYILIISNEKLFLNVPLNFDLFCDHFVPFKTAADYIYISETIETLEESGKIFETKMIGWTPFNNKTK